MKRFINILCILFCAGKLHSQNSISGVIYDAHNKETLTGVSIYYPDLKKGTTSDQDGRFLISDLPSGNFLMEIRLIGYSVQIQKVPVSGQTIRDFSLEESHKDLNEIVVTGVSASTAKAINPVQSISISKRELEQRASTNLIDAVSHKPGISQITTGTGISKPVIRGLGFNRVVVLQNGIRQEGQQWGDEHGIEIDEFSVDRVEIIKGPGSLIYGSDAIGGVINFLPPNPVDKGVISGKFLSSYQTNNQLQGYSIQNSGNIRDIFWNLQGTSKLAGNYQNAFDGKVHNSGFNELNFNGTIGVTKKWGYSQINFGSFNQNLALVEGERDEEGRFITGNLTGDTLLEEIVVSEKKLSDYYIDIPRQQVNHTSLSSTSKLFFTNSSLSLTLGLQENRRREFEYLEGDNGTQTTYFEGNTLHFLLQTLNYNLTYHLPVFQGWESAIGINGYTQRNTNKGVEFLIPEYSLYDAGIYGVIKKSLQNLHLSAGLRYNKRTLNTQALFLNPDGSINSSGDLDSEVKFEAFSNNLSVLAGSLGLSYNISPNLIAKFNLSNAFRGPNISELSSNGAHEGTFRYEIGNKDLKSEISLQADGGILLDARHLSVELGIFNNHLKNYIFAQKISSFDGGDSLIIDNQDSLSVFQFVQGTANLFGGEISIDIHPHPFDWLHFENSFSIVRGIQANQTDSFKYLPFIPAPKFQSQLRAQIKNMGKNFANLFISAELDHYFAQNQFYKAFDTETATPSYTLVNTGIGTDIVNKDKRTVFSFYFTVSNLLNETYQSHLSRLKYAPQNLESGRTGVFNMGRNFNLKLSIPFNFTKAR